MAHLRTLTFRVTDSGNLFLALVELQTLASILALSLIELQTLETFPFPCRVTNSSYHILPCGVTNPGKHLFLPCRVTNFGSILGSDHAFTNSLWLNTNNWFSSNLLFLLATQSIISFFVPY